MKNHNLTVSRDTNVALQINQTEHVKLTFGSEPNQLSLTGPLIELHVIIIEADRQLSHLTNGVTKYPGLP
jgi:hypothetical protein